MPKTDRLNIKAAINYVKLESLPYFTFTGKAEIVPWGIDNIYPYRIVEAIKKSPTALGCVKRQSEFIFGQGILGAVGQIIVNQNGETLNDVIWQCIRHGYSTLYGFGLHYNFNALGQIAEIYFVNPEYIRKHRRQPKVEYGVFHDKHNTFTNWHNITVDRYGEVDVFEGMARHGVRDYRGQVDFFVKDREIYPTSPIDAASISASFEKEAQIYPYANIRNGFSGNTLIKLPTLSSGEEAEKETGDLQDRLESVHGSDKAGSSVVINTPVNASGEAKEFKMIEHLSPTNVDGLFEKQNKKAERDILKQYMMPEILLGVSSQGMFNEAEFNDAFDYKNSDTEHDRNEIERVFNKILPKSIWNINSIQLEPLKMKKQAQTMQTNVA